MTASLSSEPHVSKFSLERVLRVGRKELSTYFSSPVAFVFLGTFLFTVLFVFFWVERFFARNIADARPLFEWMPILLIFLVAALTMRMWSEERRMGTVEFLLTLPVRTSELVLGKFLSCIGLVVLALVLTLPIPITVSLVGNLDWGPVFGAYLATVFLAGAYSAIGLFISAKTESQIVSLISTVLVCFTFYLIGTDSLTAYFGNTGSEFLQLIAPGARFESITRGVLDLRDIYYYLSIIGVFTALNIYSLERLRWLQSGAKSSQHTGWKNVTALLVLNLLVANVWLHTVRQARVDITAGNIYSISDTTENYLTQLKEPLLIRGYFSSRTHPLLAPLVPQMRDLMREFEIAGNGRVRVEIIDPKEDEDLEEEANRKYGIRPIPFQIADKYQASVVSSYFDILIEYGDKYEVLSFRDLIDVKQQAETQIDVQLRNPEYDLTRSIKKVLYGFKNIDHVFASLTSPVHFTAILDDDGQLPDELVTFKSEAFQKVSEVAQGANGNLVQTVLGSNSPEGKELIERYRIAPLGATIFNPAGFQFTMILSNGPLMQAEANGEQPVQLPVPQDLTADSFQKSLEAGLKRFSPGFLRTLGLVTPPAPPQNPMMAQFGMQNPGKRFTLLRTKLQETYALRDVQLDSGTVPDDIDMLLVTAPKELNEKQLFALDQFLMKGRTIFLATSPYEITRTNTALRAVEQASGLEDWLDSFGVSVNQSFVLDTENEVFPVPIQRRRGAFTINEIAVLRYPYFLDVRPERMNQEISLLSGLDAITINWPAPINYEKPEGSALSFTKLLESTGQSWTSDSTEIAFDPNIDPRIAFAPYGEQKAQTVGAMLEGSFNSFFKGKENPLVSASEEATENPDAEGEEDKTPGVYSSIVESSPGSARLILISSADFLSDTVLQLSAGIGSTKFVNSLQLVENSADWSLEDRGLLAIRARGKFSRTLRPIPQEDQKLYEYANYFLALLGLFLVYILYRQVFSRTTEGRYRSALAS